MFNQKLLNILVKIVAIAAWILLGIGTLYAISMAAEFEILYAFGYFVGAEAVFILYFAWLYLFVAAFHKYLCSKK